MEDGEGGGGGRCDEGVGGDEEGGVIAVRKTYELSRRSDQSRRRRTLRSLGS